MDIKLCKLKKKPESTKQPQNDSFQTFQCTLLDNCNIINPIVKLHSPDTLIDMVTKTVSNQSIVHITDGASGQPCPSVVASIVPVQSGSGTPSPQNVRSISGFSSAVLARDQGTGTTPTTYTASLGRTVYGGSHDFVSGQGTITFVKDVFRWGDGVASTNLGTHTRRRFDLTVKADNTTSSTKSLCSIATWNVSSSLDDVHYNIYSPDANTNRFICFLPNNISDDTMIEVCYPIETQTTFSLTPQAITTAQGVNNFYADTGDILTFTYKAYEQSSNMKIWDFNYGYIPDFHRYYFVRNVEYNLGTWLFHLESDGLATKKGEIGASEHYIERCSYEFDGDIIDSMYPTKTNIDYRVATTANDNATIFGQAPSPSFIVGFIGGVAEDNLPKVDQCYNGSVVYFCLTQDQLYDLVFMLLGAVNLYQIPTSEMSYELQKQLINPMQYIHSIKCVPFNPNVDSDAVAVAVYCGFQYLQIPNGSWKIISAPTIGQASSDNGYLEKRSVNFRIPVHPDYVDRGHFVCGTPYSKYIFEVNAFGQIEIPSSAVLAADVKYDDNTQEYYLNLVITTIFDISTGDCTLFLQFRDPPAQVSDVKPAEAFISITKNLAIDVPVHQSIQDAMTFRQKDRELKFQTIGAVTTLLKAAPEAIAKTAAFGFTPDQLGLVDTAVDITAKMMKTIDDATIANQVQISGTGNNGSYMSYNRDLLRPRVHCYFAPFAEENNAERGKPLCAVRKISDIPGYILCSGAEFESDLTATENETISRYLNGGFFYE